MSNSTLDNKPLIVSKKQFEQLKELGIINPDGHYKCSWERMGES